MDEREERMRAGMLEYGPLFAFWSIWIILAIAGMYVLELMKMRIIKAYQTHTFGPIRIFLAVEE